MHSVAALFEGFRLDRRGLFRLDQDGVDQPIALSSRALDLLRILVERRGELVSKDQIMEAVWPQRVVEEGNLTVQISALRRILDRDRAAQGSCIQTVSGRGYRFTAAVAGFDAAAMASTRRLAAILVADVAGCSRLMGMDEEGTLERLKAHSRELIDPKIREHQGRIVKTTGHGMLVEFASVADAVRCAAEVQRGMTAREPELPDERRIELRIGINLGDVIAEGDDIFGDGVNIAARLEALADPGGICISRTVREQIRDKLPYPLQDRGEQKVKNIAQPVRVYALSPQGVAHLPTRDMATAARRRRPVALAAIGAAAAAALVIAGTGWWLWAATKPSPIPAAAVATPISQPLVRPRLSIVVLPFVNLGDDPEQQYFIDAVTEDLTTDLSRISESFVISRNTAFTYRDTPVDAKQIGRELGVRYMLEGSVQRSGNQLRINVQLVNADIGAHLWTERFDRDMDDLFAVQNEITSRIANALYLETVAAEAARPTENPDALDHYFRGRAATSKAPTRKAYAEGIRYFERALMLAPQFVAAQGALASTLAGRAMDNLTDSAADDILRADELSRKALAAEPRSSNAHHARAQVLRAQGRCEEAIPEYETALALYRNRVNTMSQLGQCRLLTGSTEEAVRLADLAIRLSPLDPNIATWYRRIGAVRLLQSRTDEAIVWFERARNNNPEHPTNHAHLASAYGLKGDLDRAAAELAEARTLTSGDRYSSIARLDTAGYTGAGYWGVPKIRALFETTYFAGLRRAGMPEE